MLGILPSFAPPKQDTQADLTVLACSTRLQILHLLACHPGALTVQGLHAALADGHSQPTLCYHLRKLREAGLIALADQETPPYREHYHHIRWRAFDSPRAQLADVLTTCPARDVPDGYQRQEGSAPVADLWSLLFTRPLRLTLLQLIIAGNGDRSVRQLTELAPPWSLSTVSQQVFWLAGVGLLVYRDENHFRYYRADGAKLAAMLHDFDLFRALERRTS